jgi:hypothetical protein
MQFIQGVNGSAGEVITFTAPALQYTSLNSFAERNGLTVDEINFALRTDSSGTSPLTITIT